MNEKAFSKSDDEFFKSADAIGGFNRDDGLPLGMMYKIVFAALIIMGGIVGVKVVF